MAAEVDEVRTLKALFVGALVGVAAGAGQCAGLVLGMFVGGKPEILLGAGIGLLAGTATGSLLVRMVFGSMGTLPVFKVMSIEAFVVVGVVGALLLSGVSIFEHDVINPLFLVGPGCCAWAIASGWAFLGAPVEQTE